MAGVAKRTKEMNPHQPVAGFTGVLDTTETAGGLSVRDQIEQSLNYRNQHLAPEAPDELSDDNAENRLNNEPLGNATTLETLNEDTVAGTPLGDGYKDPADQLENPTETDLGEDGKTLGHVEEPEITEEDVQK